jgi:hypothetical protein
MSESDFPLPPPTFEFLVFSLKAQAEMQLGLYGFSGDQPEEPNLPGAKHAIDMLSMVAEKTRGNLALEEQRLLENSLTELRFRFVQISDERARIAKAPASGTEGKPETQAKPEAEAKLETKPEDQADENSAAS